MRYIASIALRRNIGKHTKKSITILTRLLSDTQTYRRTCSLMQLRTCRYPTCNNLIPINQVNPFCKEHVSYYKERHYNPYHKTDYKRYNRYKRDTKANAFYHSREWTQLARSIKQEQFFTCQCCGRTKDGKSYLVVDHIIPLKVDKSRRLSRSNLWLLCKQCHYWKTKLEQEIYGASLIDNLDTSKKWPLEKIKKYILEREK